MIVTREVKLGLGSVLVGALVLALKFLAYLLTGSIALYSDALESTINIATAIASLIAVWVSAKPADPGHPYGHQKAEYLSAVLVGALIFAASGSILYTAYLDLLNPKSINAPVEGLLANGFATLINVGWCWALIRQGRRWRSPALTADGRHLLTDVWTSGGVIVGVALAAITGLEIIDPIVAMLVGLNVLWSGWAVVRDSLGGLMDEAVAPDVLARIRNVISLQADGALEAHDLRTRHAGRLTFIDFHLVMPGQMSVADAHAVCDRLEEALKAEVHDALITIHVEPDTKAKHSGIVVL